MKKLTIIGLFLTMFIFNGFSSETLIGKAKFVSIAQSKRLLMSEDDYITNWSKYDIDARMQKQNSNKDELIQYISKQPKEWTEDEKNKITSVLKSIDEEITRQGYKMDFPNKIFFIKSACADEGGAEGYTRRNYIVLKNTVLAADDGYLKHLIAHELFHILTRNNTNFKKQMYPIIGFQMMQPIEFPDSLKNLKVTNPDCPVIDSYITLYENEKPVKCVMALYSRGEYNGGNLFSNLTLEFFSLNEDMTRMDKMINRAQMTGFFEQVGKNTHYLINPEEILADNFAFTILGKTEMPDQQIIEKIKKLLKN